MNTAQNRESSINVASLQAHKYNSVFNKWASRRVICKQTKTTFGNSLYSWVYFILL
jgi:hypothetical protein